jgi:hypothetical protein
MGCMPVSLYIKDSTWRGGHSWTWIPCDEFVPQVYLNKNAKEVRLDTHGGSADLSVALDAHATLDILGCSGYSLPPGVQGVRGDGTVTTVLTAEQVERPEAGHPDGYVPNSRLYRAELGSDGAPSVAGTHIVVDAAGPGGRRGSVAVRRSSWIEQALRPKAAV